MVGSHDCAGFSIDADRIEGPVWASVSAALQDPELLLRQHQERMDRLGVEDEFELERKQISMALRRIAVQQGRITDAYRDEAMELDRYGAEMAKLRQRRQGMQSRLDELERLSADANRMRSAVGEIAEFCEQVSVGIESLGPEQREELLRLLVERVTVRDGEAVVEAVIPPGGGEDGTLRTRDPELDSKSRVIGYQASSDPGRRL